MIWIYICVRLSMFSVEMLFKNELSFLRCKMSKKKVIYWLCMVSVLFHCFCNHSLCSHPCSTKHGKGMVCKQMKRYDRVNARWSSDLSLLAILITKGRTALLKDMEGKEYVWKSENHAFFVVQCIFVVQCTIISWKHVRLFLESSYYKDLYVFTEWGERRHTSICCCTACNIAESLYVYSYRETRIFAGGCMGGWVYLREVSLVK